MPNRPSPRTLVGALAAVALLAIGAWWAWGSRESSAPPSPDAPVAPVARVEPAAPPPAASAPVGLPMAPASAPDDPPPLAADDAAVTAALVELLGRDAVLKLLLTDSFAARVAATVDNLPRAHAPARLWPLAPAAGRFGVDAERRIAASNAARHDAAVGLLTALPPPAAAALYRRLYPQLQAAYVELGYPSGSFHARLLTVIDHLLQTPQPAAPPQMTLVEVRGEVPSQRPWVRYEYADPTLQARSAGQRALLRLGPAHQARVMDWLRALRPLL